MDGVTFDYSVGFPQEHPQEWKNSMYVVHKEEFLRLVQGSTNSPLSANVQPVFLVPHEGILTYFTSIYQ